MEAPKQLMSPLSTLPPGQVAEVVRITASGLVRRRLADLGFVPGTRVEVERLAPLGEPRLVRIRGSRFAMRSSEARWVLVRPVPTAATAGA